MQSRYFHRARVNAPIEIAWAVITEHTKYAEWTNIDWQIKTPGEPEPNGLGCVRVAHGSDAVPFTLEEVVNYWKPNELFGYHVLSGFPLDLHQGIVRFCSHGPSQSEWVYDMQLHPSKELLEQAPNFYEENLVRFGYFMDDIEAECERRASRIDVPAYPIRFGWDDIPFSDGGSA